VATGTCEGILVGTCREVRHVRRAMRWQGKRIGSRGCVREGLALGVRGGFVGVSSCLGKVTVFV
jgi:hypothetical protein